MSKIIAFMPIKLNSERCKEKNIRLLGKKPLLQYELETLKETGLVDDINVFCSSERVISYLPSGVNFIKRSTSLDLPSSNFTQFTKAFLEEKDADIYVLLHATAPFITVKSMIDCITAVKSGKYDSAFCAEKIQTFLWKNNKPVNFDPVNLPRTQDLEPIYKETSGIYVFTKEVFLKYNRRIGINPYINIVSFKEAIDIDEEEDFILAQKFIDIDI